MRRENRDDFAVCIVAGGEATRLPGKLFLDAGGVPMLERVYRNVAGIGDVTISTSARLRDDVMRLLPRAHVIVDAEVRGGPLAALTHVLAQLAAERVLVVAGDAPFLNHLIFDRLFAARQSHDDVVVPVHGSGEQVEPLAALYRRERFVTAAREALRNGRRSLLAALELLQVRRVPFEDSGQFVSLNTDAEYRAAIVALSAAPPHG